MCCLPTILGRLVDYRKNPICQAPARPTCETIHAQHAEQYMKSTQYSGVSFVRFFSVSFARNLRRIACATPTQSPAIANSRQHMPAYVTHVANVMSDRTTPGQRTSERDFVSIFEVAADRQTARQARDLDVGLRQQLRKETGGRLAD